MSASAAAAPVVGSGIVGYIRPPPEIRAIADKTAQFVARNGSDFEAKIARDKGADPKFAFLNPANPYHAYYRHMVEQALAPPAPVVLAPATAVDSQATTESASEQTASSSSATSSSAAPPPGSASAASTVPAARRADVLPNPLSRALKAVDLSAPPPGNEFTVVQPTYANQETIDIIKLTAQYTAVAGRQFLAGLAARESRNSTFDFLRPSSSLFHFFTSCVDAYSRALRPSVEVLERLAVDSTGRSSLLQRVVSRYAHAQAGDEKKRSADAAAANERSAMAQIDWHDAVVVETVGFDEEDPAELAALPPPLPHPSSVLLASGASASALPRAATKASTDIALQLASAIAEGLSGPVASPPAARAAAAIAAPASAAAPTAAAAADVEMEADEDEEQIRVVTDYVPQMPSGPSHAPALSTFLDPRSGREIPIDQAGRHMRIETLDPRWAEQRAKHEARQSTTLLAGGDEMAENLRRLAAQRTDVFRGDGGEGGEPAAKRAKQG